MSANKPTKKKVDEVSRFVLAGHCSALASLRVGSYIVPKSESNAL